MNVQNAASKALHRTESPVDGLNQKALKALVKEQAALGVLLHKQSQEMAALRHDVRQSRHRGGFPWSLIVLAGGAYAAYRFIPAVKDQVNGLLGRLDPGVEGNLHCAGDTAKDAVHDVAQGRDPSDGGRARVGTVFPAKEFPSSLSRVSRGCAPA